MFGLKTIKTIVNITLFFQNGGEEERVEGTEGERKGRVNKEGMRQTDGKKQELNTNLGTNPTEQGE